jgi:hypothetical protein
MSDTGLVLEGRGAEECSFCAERERTSRGARGPGPLHLSKQDQRLVRRTFVSSELCGPGGVAAVHPLSLALRMTGAQTITQCQAKT